MRLRYLDMLRDGSMRSCMSLKSRWYLLGSFSHVCLRRDTAPWPSPDMMLNIELKFLHSLHWRATLMNCLMVRIRRMRFCSEQISVTTQNISRFTSCKEINQRSPCCMMRIDLKDKRERKKEMLPRRIG